MAIKVDKLLGKVRENDGANKADLVGGKVPASQLPSYVDDVVEVANYAALPVTGEASKIYITIDDNKTYRRTGTVYVQVGAGADEKVKYDVNDTTAGYIADKFIAGVGITVAEGTGADENKLQITNSDRGSSVTTTTLGLNNVNNTSDANKPISTATQTALNAKKYYHGVYSRATVSPLPTNLTSTTFTLAANVTNITYYYLGTAITVSTAKTATLDDGLGGTSAGLYYVYFNAGTGNILATKTFPGISNTSNVIIASVNWNGSNYGIVSDERHGYDRDHAWHIWAHDTIGCRYESGLNFSFAGNVIGNTTFALSTGTLHDEDIDFSVAGTTARIRYQTGASTYAFDNVLSTTPYKQNGTGIQAVNSAGYGLVTITSSSRYFNYFVYGTNSNLTPIHIFCETTATTGGYNSATTARAVPAPSLAGFGLAPEYKLLYRIVVNGAGLVQTPVASDDYRTTSTVSGGALTTVSASSVTENNYGNVQSAINNIIAQTSGYSTTATAAGTTTLTVASTHEQFFTGTTTQTVVLPVVSTLTIGTTYTIVNQSTGLVTIQSSGANTVLILAGGTQADFTSIAITGTDQTVRYAWYEGEVVTSGKKLTVSNDATITGTNTGDQTITNSSDATSHTVTVSASGGSVKLIEGTGITLTTGGTGGAGEVTIASTATGGYNPILAQVFF